MNVTSSRFPALVVAEKKRKASGYAATCRYYWVFADVITMSQDVLQYECTELRVIVNRRPNFPRGDDKIRLLCDRSDGNELTKPLFQSALTKVVVYKAPDLM